MAITHRASVWAVGAVAAACAVVLAQPGAAPVPAEQGTRKPPAGSPLAAAPAYEVLRGLEGTWDVKATFWLMPGAAPTTTTCTCTSKMVLGGLYLEERLTGGSIGGPQGALPWDCIWLTGYDAGKGEYHVTRLSGTSPVPMPERGTWNAEKRELESAGSFRMMYMDMKMRSVARTVDDSTRIIEQYLSMNGAPEFKGILVEMKRQK